MVGIYQKAIEAYKLIFPELRLNSFEERLKFQKTIYLLKAFGVNFQELNFTWYKRGPYCFELIGVQYRKGTETNNLAQEETENIKKNKAALAEFLKDPNTAELYASVAYLSFEERLDEKEVIRKMGLIKPWFKQEDIARALQKLKQYSQENKIAQ